jgi:hypothetical protein
MSINLEYSATAKCRPEHIWKVFEKLEQWAWWNPGIGRTKWTSGEPWQKGSHFDMELERPRRLKFDCEVLEPSIPNKVGWRGKGHMTIGEHWFSFEEQPSGTTLLKTWETLSGFGSMFIGKGMQQKTLDSYKLWFERLAAEAEKIAREELARA